MVLLQFQVEPSLSEWIIYIYIYASVSLAIIGSDKGCLVPEQAILWTDYGLLLIGRLDIWIKIELPYMQMKK